jgi:hypothetical protein
MPFFIVFFFSFFSPAVQEEVTTYRSFTIHNREAVWSQVYQANSISAGDLSIKLFTHLKGRIWLTNLQYEGQDIVGDIQRMKIEYKKYGGRFMNTSTILRTGTWYGKLRISFKDEKYRVVIYDLHYTAMQPATGSGKLTMEAHEISGTFSEWVLNNYHTEFRKSRFTNLDIIHTSLNDKFILQDKQATDNAW